MKKERVNKFCLSTPSCNFYFKTDKSLFKQL